MVYFGQALGGLTAQNLNPAEIVAPRKQSWKSNANVPSSWSVSGFLNIGAVSLPSLGGCCRLYLVAFVQPLPSWYFHFWKAIAPKKTQKEHQYYGHFHSGPFLVSFPLALVLIWICCLSNELSRPSWNKKAPFRHVLLRLQSLWNDQMGNSANWCNVTMMWQLISKKKRRAAVLFEALVKAWSTPRGALVFVFIFVELDKQGIGNKSKEQSDDETSRLVNAWSPPCWRRLTTAAGASGAC